MNSKKFLITIVTFLSIFHTFSATCNWKSRNPYVYFFDSCNGKKIKYSANGYIAFNFSGNGCFKYQWYVNGTAINTGRIFNYKITSNGTYNICVKVIDTCNNCDTTFCSYRTFTCVNSCIWKTKNPYFTAWDSCNGKKNKYSLNGYIYFNTSNTGCFKYAWYVNGTKISNSRSLTYPITQNGSYVICMKVTDTCNNCDTSFCSSRSITCIPFCNWNKRNPYFSAWDSCNAKKIKYSVNGYIGFNFSGNTCFKYYWYLNGNLISTQRYLIAYPISQNGTYNLCVKVKDTCNNCDTTFCSVRNITCVGNKCNWKNRNMYFSTWDSCSGKKDKYSLNAYIGPYNSCYKYYWYINGVYQTSNRFMHYKITQNGKYSVCVKIYDTCNKCDTSYCDTKTITCVSPCNWKNKISGAFIYVTDTCPNKKFYGGISIANGYSIDVEWTDNGNIISSNNTFYYTPSNNGYHLICLHLSDSANNCDTTLCYNLYYNCSGKCDWYKRTNYLTTWDSCAGKKNKYSINGYYYGSNIGCYKYLWTVNGNYAGNSRILSYPINKNGVYYTCLKITDTCNKCDTTFCSKRTITCVNTCNWKSRNPYFSAWDSCGAKKIKYSINGYIGFNFSGNTCFKYYWYLNGNLISTQRYLITYPITQNGTYYLCMKVKDTCNNCDTTFCSIRKITCIAPPCNWKNRNMYFATWDSCNGSFYKTSVNGYIGPQNNCYKYYWLINNKVVGNGRVLHYKITQNGTYNVCAKIVDSCTNNCDTSFCYSYTINCAATNNNTIIHKILEIYPNPAESFIQFNWHHSTGNYRITSFNGALIKKGNVNSGLQKISLSDIANGIYFLQINYSNITYYQKIVVCKN